jgi:hypothetical protein
MWTTPSMKTSTATLAVLLSLQAYAQGLTYAEVFDYDLGDVVQSSYRYDGMEVGLWPRRYVRDSIIDIAYNVNGLEVEYTSQQHRFCLPGGPFPAEDVVETVHFGYVDGTAFPEHADLGNNCEYYVPFYDAVEPWPTACGRDTWTQRFLLCSGCSCLEMPSDWRSHFVAGVGGPYYWRLAAEFPSDYAVQHDLVYYRKGAEECGTEVVMGVSERQAPEPLVLAPNPAVDVVKWSASTGTGDVVLMDLSGRVLLQGRDIGLLVIEDLSSGAYQLVLRSTNGDIRAARFVKR